MSQKENYNMDANMDVTKVNYPSKKENCKPRHPMVVLEKLLYLIEEPMSDSCIFRHLLLLDEFLAGYTTDFWMKDLPELMKLLELLVQKINVYPQYIIPLNLLLEKTKRPPILYCCSEKLDCGRDLAEYFNLLGFILLEINDQSNLEAVAKIIVSLLECDYKYSENRVSKQMINKAVEESLLPVIISQLYVEAEGNYYKLLLKAGSAMALISSNICEKMINQRVYSNIIWRLDPNCKKRIGKPPSNPDSFTADKIYYLSDTTKLLWYLLKGASRLPDKTNLKVGTLTQECWWSFRYAFKILWVDNRAKLDRNFLTACFIKGLFLYPNLNLTPTKFPKDFCRLCTLTDFKSGDYWLSNVRHSQEILDYKFKKMLTLLIDICCRYYAFEPIKKYRITMIFLNLISPHLNAHWRSLQYSKLIVVALCTCTTLAYNLPDEFLKYDGPQIILNIIKYYLEYEYVTKILMMSLYLIWKALQKTQEKLMEEFKKKDIISVLLRLCNYILAAEKLILVLQDCLGLSFVICEIFIITYMEANQELIDICLNYLNRTLNPHQEDTIHDPKVAIACISLLWECIKYNQENFNYFIAKEGVYLLLDVIEKHFFAIKIIALGMLVDLCEESATIPYLLTWRKNGTRYVTLLMNVVRSEHKRNKVKMRKNGVIDDIYRPLMGEIQVAAADNCNTNSDSSACIMDMYGSCRSKVYAIMQLIKRHQDVVNIVNEQYKIQTFRSSIHDKITALLMDNYLALKLGEMWTEVANYIKNEGIKLSCMDTMLISTLTIRLPKWALHIQKQQIALLNKQKNKEKMVEKETYNKLKEMRLSESLEAMHELDYIARTTESIFRLTKKMKQRNFIDGSRVEYMSTAQHHNTFLYNLNINSVFKQSIKIESSVIKNPVEEDYLPPVSPTSSVEDVPLPMDDFENDWSKIE